MDKDDNYIAKMMDEDDNGKCKPECIEGNARLIAAAPELVELFEEALDALSCAVNQDPELYEDTREMYDRWFVLRDKISGT